MELENVLCRLCDIDFEAQALINESGYWDDWISSSSRCWKNEADFEFMRLSLESILKSLDNLHHKIAWLASPASEEHVLRKFRNGRYGYLDSYGNPVSFSCGSWLEAKLYDREGGYHWVKVRIEHDRSDYYLYGHKDVPLQGLVVRRREVRE